MTFAVDWVLNNNYLSICDNVVDLQVTDDNEVDLQVTDDNVVDLRMIVLIFHAFSFMCEMAL